MKKHQSLPQVESEFAAQVAGEIAALEQERAALQAQVIPLQAALEVITVQILGLRAYLAPHIPPWRGPYMDTWLEAADGQGSAGEEA